ncbi:MAG: hypothetical protein Q8M92_04055 [Candidatus Subteraquimicrobiales bacterium]|nr:hypothetical protein [Candidatus Subteraquimicrobiales bacterium]
MTKFPWLKYFFPCFVVSFFIFFPGLDAVFRFRGLFSAISIPFGIVFKYILPSVLSALLGSYLIVTLGTLAKESPYGFWAQGFLIGLISFGVLFAFFNILYILILLLFRVPFDHNPVGLILQSISFPGGIFGRFIGKPSVGLLINELLRELRLWLLLGISWLSWGVLGSIIRAVLKYLKIV